MGFMDKIKGALGGHKNEVKGGIDKAGDVVDDKTGAKYADKVDSAQGPRPRAPSTRPRGTRPTPRRSR